MRRDSTLQTIFTSTSTFLSTGEQLSTIWVPIHTTHFRYSECKKLRCLEIGFSIHQFIINRQTRLREEDRKLIVCIMQRALNYYPSTMSLKCSDCFHVKQQEEIRFDKNSKPSNRQSARMKGTASTFGDENIIMTYYSYIVSIGISYCKPNHVLSLCLSR